MNRNKNKQCLRNWYTLLYIYDKLHVVRTITLLFSIMILGLNYNLTKAVAGDWVQLSSGDSAREDHSSVFYNGNLFIAGGEINGTSINSLWRYDIDLDNWHQLSNMTQDTGCHSAIINNGKMYVFGGSKRTNGSNQRIQYADIQVFDIQNNTWTKVSPGGPAARDHHTAAIYNDKMYIHGGEWDAEGPNTFHDLWEYDISSNIWSQKNSTIYLSHHSSVIYENKIYIFGGVDENNFTNKLWEYNISTDSWSQKQNAPFKRAEHSALIYKNKMYIFGGADENFSFKNELWKYNFITDSWKNIPNNAPFPTPRAMHSTSSDNNGKLYIFGGSDESENQLDELWSYKFSSQFSWNLFLPAIMNSQSE